MFLLPLFFSFLLVTIKSFLAWEATKGMALKLEVVQLTGVLTPLLLFADNIAISSHSFDALWRLVTALGCFCDCSAFIINLDNMGGCPPCTGMPALLVLLYKGAVV